MAKYPCGVCGRSVRFSAILCTGLCSKWFHFKCVNLSSSEVKNFEKENFLGEWKCSNCENNLEIKELETAVIKENNEEHFYKLNGSSLADEINRSILHENDELRQELHAARNRSSLYILELEDKLKENEETIELQKTSSKEKEIELLSRIEYLEKKLKNEKEGKETLILMVEEQAKDKITQKEMTPEKCDRCRIYAQETTKMIDTIRTLESIIKILENDNNLGYQEKTNTIETAGKSSYLHSSPPLEGSPKQQTLPVANKLQKVSTICDCKPGNYHHTNKKIIEPDFTSKNPYDVLQNDFVFDKSVEQDCNSVNTSNVSQRSSLKKEITKKANSHKKTKMLVCADSHGRNLAFHLNKHSKSFEAVGFVRPGGLAGQILNYDNIDREELDSEDVLVIACGSNDVAHNEAERALDLPFRHDLKGWSCVNKEVIKSNNALENLSKKFPNVSLVKIIKADRLFHTRHGRHLNQMGKDWLAKRICEALIKITEPELPLSQSTDNDQTTGLLPPSARVEDHSNTDHSMLHNETINSTIAAGVTDLTSSSELLVAEEEEEEASLGRFSSVSNNQETYTLNSSVWPPLIQKDDLLISLKEDFVFESCCIEVSGSCHENLIIVSIYHNTNISNVDQFLLKLEKLFKALNTLNAAGTARCRASGGLGCVRHRTVSRHLLDFTTSVLFQLLREEGIFRAACRVPLFVVPRGSG
ncbi:hypothetical protein J6590_026356 [Homalodisca vitripennis]|nr:hypothetical protein J6590_026356 [Homalodisca vitripennis]